MERFVRSFKFKQFNSGKKSNTKGSVDIHRGESVDIGGLSKKEKNTHIGVDKTNNFSSLLT